MERHIGGVLGRVHRLAVLPVAIRLVRLAETDPALLGMIRLKAGQQADVPFLLVALAVAVHLRQPVGDLRGLGINVRGGRIGQLRGGEHGRVAAGDRLRLRRHLHRRHLRRRPDDFRDSRFVLAAGGRGEDEKDESALHERPQRNRAVV